MQECGRKNDFTAFPLTMSILGTIKTLDLTDLF